METFTRRFGSLLVFVYHCFDRIVINGYLNGLSRPEQHSGTNSKMARSTSASANLPGRITRMGPGPDGFQRSKKRSEIAPANTHTSGTPQAAATCMPAES